jgi:hypothetical protein
MINPFTAWSRMLAAQAAMAASSIRAAETLTASLSVIDTRTAIMRAAMADPLSADHAELGRMVPEKIAAFSDAGGAMMRGMLAWNQALLAEAQHLGTIASRGRAPTPGEWLGLAARTAEFGVAAAEQTARVGAAALAPVHAKATANARRLKRGQR